MTNNSFIHLRPIHFFAVASVLWIGRLADPRGSALWLKTRFGPLPPNPGP